MATQIATSTYANATATPGAALIAFAPSDQSALVLFHDGSGPHLAWSQAPYTSWTTALIGGATPRHMGSIHVRADDSVDIVICSPNNDAYYFHFIRSGNAWADDGSAHPIGLGAGDLANDAQASWLGHDTQGRLWWVVIDATLATRTLYVTYSADNGATWTTSLSPTVPGTDWGLPVASIIGNYLVVCYQDGSGQLSYQRLDVSGASLGAWSAVAAINVGNDVATAIQGSLRDLGAGTGLLVHAGANGITANTYTAATDTWSAATPLSAAATDLEPTLVADGAGNAYALWSQFTASNSYALVYKKWNGSAWDATPTTILAAGTNAHYLNAVWFAGKLAYLYTLGTGSPYSVEWDTYTPGAGTTGLVTTARATLQLRASVQVPARPRFSLRTAAQTTARDTFKLASLLTSLVTTGRVIYPLHAALKSLARDTFKLFGTSTLATDHALTATFQPVQSLTVTFQEAPMQPNSNVRVTASVYDETRALVTDLATVTCLVTFPDASSQAFALASGITNNNDGSYTLAYTTKAEGTHTELWTFTKTDGTTAQYKTYTIAGF